MRRSERVVQTVRGHAARTAQPRTRPSTRSRGRRPGRRGRDAARERECTPTAPAAHPLHSTEMRRPTSKIDQNRLWKNRRRSSNIVTPVCFYSSLAQGRFRSHPPPFVVAIRLLRSCFAPSRVPHKLSSASFAPLQPKSHTPKASNTKCSSPCLGVREIHVGYVVRTRPQPLGTPCVSHRLL